MIDGRAVDTSVSSQELNCTLLTGLCKAASANAKDLKEALEKGDVGTRAQALESLIRLHLNGEPQNHMIMTVIKYVTPIDDHLIKKLVLYFWEVVDKTDKDGKLLSVIILICSFLRNDLQHPNEYVRGLTLRFLARVTERDLVEPLISSVVQNLKHTVAYVRRNAVLAVHAIYRKFPDLLHDATDLVEAFLLVESDVSARRHAFAMLAAYAPARAAAFLTDYLHTHSLAEAGGVFLMAAVDLCQQRIRADPPARATYVAILFSILQSKNAAVRFQCASTLLSLSTSPTAIRQAMLTFIDLLRTHSDTSVRLLVVEKLDGMRERYAAVLQDALLDVLSALQDGTIDIRRRVVALAQELVTAQNVDVFVQAMRKELARVQVELNATRNDGAMAAFVAMPAATGGAAMVAAGGGGVDDVATATATAATAAAHEYRLQLIRAISVAVTRFPDAAEAILPLMLDYLCEANNSSAEVAALVREIVHVQPSLRRYTLDKLTELFPLLTSPAVTRAVLWLFGAHLRAPHDVARVVQMLYTAMQPLPLTPPPTAHRDGSDGTAATTTTADATTAGGGGGGGYSKDGSGRSGSAAGGGSGSAAAPVVRAMTTIREDGTYVTMYTTVPAEGAGGGAATTTTSGGASAALAGGGDACGLRHLIVRGEHFLASSLASTLSKFVLQLADAARKSTAATATASSNSDNGSNDVVDASDEVAAVMQTVQRQATELLRELLRYGTDASNPCTMDDDAQEHIRLCLSLLQRPTSAILLDFLHETEQQQPSSPSQQQQQSSPQRDDDVDDVYATLTTTADEAPSPGLPYDDSSSSGSSAVMAAPHTSPPPRRAVAIDAPLLFAQLTTDRDALLDEGIDTSSSSQLQRQQQQQRRLVSALANGDNDDDDNSGGSADTTTTTAFLRTLEQVTPYSGYEDAIYAEASVHVNRFDVAVHWLLVNKTNKRLSNITIELASLGGMRLCERPQAYTLDAGAALRVHTSLKSSATETGIVFGSLLYDDAEGVQHYAPLLDIHVDIMNYVKPAYCTTAEFRDKWRAYDWENKINVSTDRYDLRGYIAHIARQLNMYLLDELPATSTTSAQTAAAHGSDHDDADNNSSKRQDDGDEDEECCEYVSCNLYARTIFNEDALANVSVECDARGHISGVIRIRSNTQSVAYGIGEKVNQLEKAIAAAAEHHHQQHSGGAAVAAY